MAIRLTETLRDDILYNLMRHRFEKEEAKLDRLRGRVALQVYRHLYTLKERKLMDSLPKGWLPRRSDIIVHWPGGTQYLAFPDDQSKPFPHKDHGHASLRQPEDGDLIARLDKMDHQSTQLENKKSEIRLKTLAALRTVTTLKRLLEEWPELKPYVSDYINEPKAVAIRREELNEALMLP